MAAGGYTVQRSGETLRSVAQSVWGDASLWYKLADANGMKGDLALSEGQHLSLPAGVSRTRNNASTLKPYDASDAIGNVSPSTPKPAAKGNKCGTFGLILLAVIAIAVTAITAGGAIAALAPASQGITGVLSGLGALAGGSTGLGAAALVGIGAVAGAVGSIVSQGVGVATGIQDKFSWKAVGLSALAGGISAGIGPGGLFGTGFAGALGVGSKVLQAGINGAVSSAITQGLGVATGLQSKFDFIGVAAAGIGAGVGQSIHLGGFGGTVVRNAASGLANAATRSVIEGSDFGDNLIAALPDIIGQTVGGLVAQKVAGSGRRITDASKTNDTEGQNLYIDEATGEKRLYLLDPDQVDPDHLTYGLTFSDGHPVGPARITNGAADWEIGPDGKVYPTTTAEPGDIVVTADKGKTDAARAANRAREDAYAREDAETNALLQNFMWSISPLPQSPFKQDIAVGNYWPPAISATLSIPINWYGRDGDPGPVWKAYNPLTEDRWSPYYGMTDKQAAFSLEMDRREGGTFSALSYGVASFLGASESTREAAYTAGTAGDGLFLSLSAARGAIIPGAGNQRELSIVNGENGVHANSRLSGRTTYLYELETRTGEFLKHGISVNPDTRYSKSFMADKLIRPVTSGSRADMLALEKQIVIANPGPINREPWAVKARGSN